MKPSLIALALLFFGLTAHAKPVPVIFDTDITGDVDDVLALAMLHTLADRGQCEILAVTISKENELAAPFVDAVNTFYGRPDIPIGIGENVPYRESKFLQLVKEKDGEAFRYPHDIGVTKEPELAVPLIQKVLAAAGDNSVAIIQVGLATNIAQLLESEGGKALIEQKVDHLSLMAGGFETINGNNRFLEANVRNHIPSMQVLADQWPDSVPAIWSGFKIGISAPYPRESIAKDFDYVDHHIVKEAYLLHCGPNHDRPTWDLTSVLYSVFPDRGYFDYSPRGRVTVEDDSFTSFVPVPGTPWGSAKKSDRPEAQKRDRYLKMNEAQAARVQEAIVHLVVQPPRHLKPDMSKALNVIFDTDMGNDTDDAMALAMLHTLQSRGLVNLLGITSTKDDPRSAAYLDAFNTFYGRPQIPIGTVRNGVNPEMKDFLKFAAEYPHDLKSGQDAERAMPFLRKLLVAQPDQSVTLIQVGFFTNFARLLETEGDDISPLTGMELVKQKVIGLHMMAGAFQTVHYNNRYREYNVTKHLEPAKQLTANWPTPIFWSGFEIGYAAPYPWQSIDEDFESFDRHILKDSYIAYAPEIPHDRPSWDLTSVLYAVYPDRGYFDLSSKGTVNMHEDGMTFFRPDPRRKPVAEHKGRDRYLIMNEIQTARVREALTMLVSEPPMK
ncbi:MAG: nucleoside hydrolase [Verrucomicrobiales bacterium]|nr:nucleoside hydrolase [Verrucomicrobiales bacterium]